MSQINKVKIRMYRHGFGDCFLLRFYNDDNLRCKMLIDCGLKFQDKVKDVSIKDVVNDIALETRDEDGHPHLDILVATHEHYDHVSGFIPSKKLFEDFKVDKVWLAWTENPDDPEAREINAHLQKGIMALNFAVDKLNDANEQFANNLTGMYNGSEMLAYREQFSAALNKMLGFYGLGAAKTSGSGIKYRDNYNVSTDTQKAFRFIKGLTRKGAGVQYFNPGDLIEDNSLLAGMRIYVLGPPKSSLLNKDTPSRGGKKEVYLGNGRYAMLGFINGLLAKAPGGQALTDDSSPFGAIEQTDEKDAPNDEVLNRMYFGEKDKWRMIENDWLNMTGSLALQMDSDTNNTSLVLAIEFIESGKVLLFPGDAQVGSWLSWHDLDWEVRSGHSAEKVNARKLLANTVFYKVGHHASHNATVKHLGLELMTSNELVAFVPEKNDSYEGIPYPPLIERLREKTKGRVLVSADKNYPPDLSNKPHELSQHEWERFTSNIEVKPAYIEYTLQ